MNRNNGPLMDVALKLGSLVLIMPWAESQETVPRVQGGFRCQPSGAWSTSTGSFGVFNQKLIWGHGTVPRALLTS